MFGAHGHICNILFQAHFRAAAAQRSRYWHHARGTSRRARAGRVKTVVCGESKVLSVSTAWWLNPRSGVEWRRVESDFLGPCLSAPRSGKKWQFLVRLNGFQKETLRAQTPTAPRWKAHIETCQETRRKVVSGECCADRGPGSGAHAHAGRLPCVRRLGGQAHANVHSHLRGHPQHAPHVRAGGDLSGDGDGGEGIGDTGGRAA